jgi:hypothetical protein
MNQHEMQPCLCLNCQIQRIIAQREELMESRLAEKLKTASGVVERVHNRIEARADKVIASEPEFDKLIEASFAPHEAMLSDSERALDSFKHALAQVSNDPLQSSGDSSEAVQQPGSDAPTEPVQ